MGFPAGMQLATIAFGIPLTATGKDVVTTVTVKPTARVIWAATGQPLPEFEDSFTAEAGQLGQFQVPFVDQAGFIDSTGATVTDFAYQVTASWFFGNARPITWSKNLKPLLGQTGPIDLDLVPDGPVSIPVTAPTAAVLGFNGRTGFITLQDSDLPERLSDAQLSATYLDKTSGLSKTEAATSYSKIREAKRQANSLFRGVSIGNEGALPAIRFTGANLAPAFNTVKRYIAVKDATYVRFVYVNMWGRDNLTANQITVRAGITVGANTWPVFFSGARDVVIQPGGIVVSDPVAVTVLTAGTMFYARTYVQSSGETPLQGGGAENLTRGAWGEGCDAAFGTTQPDKSLSGTVTGSGVSHYSPAMVISGDGIGGPFVGIVGDSITAGVGDAETVVDAGRGFLRRALNNTIPFAHIGISGENWSESRHYRRPLLAGCTDVICELGINDIVSSNRTLPALQAQAITDWTFHTTAGAKVWQTTLTPKTSSTDTWATVANQTPMTNEPVRAGFNDWLRAGAPINSSKVAVAIGTAGAILAGQTGHPLSGHFDTADTVETARNSGIWKVGYVMTSDGLGIHPNSTGHAAMAAAISTSLFG